MSVDFSLNKSGLAGFFVYDEDMCVIQTKESGGCIWPWGGILKNKHTFINFMVACFGDAGKEPSLQYNRTTSHSAPKAPK